VILTSVSCQSDDTSFAAKRRLESFINGRSEWCISRQRSWGVPIPVLHDAQTGEPFLNSETLDHIIPILEEKGTDHWWSDSVDEFVPESLKSTGRQFRKGFDTMDVWFDSGSSWTILRDKGFKADSEPLADIYLEGSDQHRGWFQSSLLTRLCSAEKGQAHTPYSKVVTHGFVLAQDGSKMSKSSGNGIMPMDVIEGGKASQQVCWPSVNSVLIKIKTAGQEEGTRFWNGYVEALGGISRVYERLAYWPDFAGDGR
jgi:isoleucyl-tRNA synthetase